MLNLLIEFHHLFLARKAREEKRALKDLKKAARLEKAEKGEEDNVVVKRRGRQPKAEKIEKEESVAEEDNIVIKRPKGRLPFPNSMVVFELVNEVHFCVNDYV